MRRSRPDTPATAPPAAQAESPCGPGLHLPALLRCPTTTDTAANTLLLPSHPQVIRVSHAEQVNAIDRSSLVSLIRARLKEKTLQPGEYLFRCAAGTGTSAIVMCTQHEAVGPAGHWT